MKILRLTMGRGTEARQPAHRLSALLTHLPEYQFRSGGDPLIRAVVDHSARAVPGALFVAVAGHKADGHAYARDAIARGAVAVVATRRLDLDASVPQIVVADARAALAVLCAAFYGHPAQRVKVIGVTGTNGKTTTCFLIRSILEAAGCRTGFLGTVGYETGKRSLPAPNTTPGPADLHALLWEMEQAGAEYAVMEVSSHALVQGRTAGVPFAAAVFTNLTPEHLDYHRTMSAYRDAKELLFAARVPQGAAVINADDECGRYYRDRVGGRVVSYGLASDADVRAEAYNCTLDGSRFIIHAPKQRAVAVDTPLLGLHNVHNSLAATATALSLQISLDAVKRGIESAPAVPGRLEPVRCGQPFGVLVDYAHTPNALEAVVAALRPLVRGRFSVVFGAGGDRDRAKRPLMGAAVEQDADRIWLTSDNPRSEDPGAIIDEIRAGIRNGVKVRIEADRRRAIAGALAEAEAGDLVLIAGKGHETEQKFADRVVPFDDRAVAADILAARYGALAKGA